ncbi:hypothetical protein QCA50_016308 [Cerrena zonata]|uniref:DUF4283 domain-containing protein n=1 Tax=Cerrena zonata TaxID=2478898 RepID=A0AAW0FK17_9APHY
MVSEGVIYTSETGDVSVDRSSVTLWIFPVLFKQTAGPWVNINMEGVKIRIPNGKSTPHFVKQLRKNLVGTLVCGEIYRVDDFGTKIIFAGLTDRDAGAGNDNQHDGNKRHQETSSDIHTSSRSQTKDELRISSFLRGLHLHNTEGRIYTFGEVDAQLRRNWTENRGSFVMVAKESRWLRVHWPYQRLKTIPTWVQFLSAIIQFPLDLFHALRHPMSTINLYITQVDVTFDEFKIRDAELIMQMIGIIAEKRHLHNIQWQDVFADALTQCLQGLVS